MKNYVRFYEMSTGKWVDGKMNWDMKYPIEGCGSDSVMYYDGRLNLSSICYQARQRIIQMNAVNRIVGFKVYKNGNEVYSTVPTAKNCLKYE